MARKHPIPIGNHAHDLNAYSVVFFIFHDTFYISWVCRGGFYSSP